MLRGRKTERDLLPRIRHRSPEQLEPRPFCTNLPLVLASSQRRAPQGSGDRDCGQPGGQGRADRKGGYRRTRFHQLHDHSASLEEVPADILLLGTTSAVALWSGPEVLVEFVSANPTGLCDWDTARGPALGDTLCRISASPATRWCASSTSRRGPASSPLGESVYSRWKQHDGS